VRSGPSQRLCRRFAALVGVLGVAGCGSDGDRAGEPVSEPTGLASAQQVTQRTRSAVSSRSSSTRGHVSAINDSGAREREVSIRRSGGSTDGRTEGELALSTVTVLVWENQGRRFRVLREDSSTIIDSSAHNGETTLSPGNYRLVADGTASISTRQHAEHVDQSNDTDVDQSNDTDVDE
jgi:hypothetical protein